MQTTYLRERRALAQLLRSLREDSGYSGNQLARRLGWAQSKVSRIETARQLPSASDVERWIEALGHGLGIRGECLTRLERARNEYQSWRSGFAVAGGADKRQEQLLFLEAQTHVLKSFQPLIVPGLLQTKNYATELLRRSTGPLTHGATPQQIAEMVAVRLRRQRILFDSEKSISILMLEACLYAGVTRAVVLLEQLDYIDHALRQHSSTIGILPLAAELPIFLFSGFDIHDSDLVILEDITGEQQLSDSSDIRLYTDCFDQLSSAALRGVAASALVDAARRRIQRDRSVELAMAPREGSGGVA